MKEGSYMRIITAEDYQDMSRKVADLLSAEVVLRPDCTLGLATGSTPVGAYKILSERCAQGDLNFSRIKTINLDEYVGLPPTHKQSYRFFMQDNFFDHINIHPENTYVPNGMVGDVEAECRRYDEIIRVQGPVSVQLLGLGHDGHIGFNEPADTFTLPTHPVELAQATIDANARFFASADEVPRREFTMGIGAIMQAEKVILAVSGQAKAETVRKAFRGPVTPQVPASVLQLHPKFVLVGDREALSLL